MVSGSFTGVPLLTAARLAGQDLPIGSTLTLGGDWSIRAAMSQGDLSSWNVAGAYASRTTSGPHRYDLGHSDRRDDFSRQRQRHCGLRCDGAGEPPQEGIADDKLVEAVEFLLSKPDIVIQEEALVRESIAHAGASGAGLVDCLISVINRQAGCDTTYTFDRRAAKLDAMTLIES